jgi:L-threonylcarbamoyladenylate synthase
MAKQKVTIASQSGLLDGRRCKIMSVRDSSSPSIAAQVMAAGGIVAYPTETAYALGCSGLDARAVSKIYKIKGRDKSKPLPVIMADAEMAAKFTISTGQERALIRKFMPGPLTIAAKKRVAIPASGDAPTIAFRIPSSEFARKASRMLGAPIVSTSANISGEEAIYEIGKILELFSATADLIVDGGDLEPVPASTIVCLLGAPKILREGPIESSAIMGALGRKKKKPKVAEKKQMRAKNKTRKREERK